jgi:hypothetical protein
MSYGVFREGMWIAQQRAEYCVAHAVDARIESLDAGEAEAQHRAVTSEVSLIATIADERQRTVGKGKSMLTVVVRDGSGVDAHLVCSESDLCTTQSDVG